MGITTPEDIAAEALRLAGGSERKARIELAKALFLLYRDMSKGAIYRGRTYGRSTSDKASG